MENPIKMDDLGVPLFTETSIYVRLVLVLSLLQACDCHSKKKHIKGSSFHLEKRGSGNHLGKVLIGRGTCFYIYTYDYIYIHNMYYCHYVYHNSHVYIIMYVVHYDRIISENKSLHIFQLHDDVGSFSCRRTLRLFCCEIQGFVFAAGSGVPCLSFRLIFGLEGSNFEPQQVQRMVVVDGDDERRFWNLRL